MKSKTAERGRRGSAMKQIQVSEICSAGDRISHMLDRLSQLQEQSAALQANMEVSIARGNQLHEQREQRLLREQRVVLLQREVEKRRQGVVELRARLDGAREQQQHTVACLESRKNELSQAEEDQRQAAPSLKVMYRSFASMRRQLRCRQMRMMQEVCEVYPIEQSDGCWRIRRLILTSIESLSRQDFLEEEVVSTALGFLAHLMVMLAGILEVPLRITIHNAGCSRCAVSDPHESLSSSALAGEWPLYYGGGHEKSRFINAMHLLRDGLHQFLYSRGYFDEKRFSSGNPLECAEVILRKEMQR